MVLAEQPAVTRAWRAIRQNLRETVIAEMVGFYILAKTLSAKIQPSLLRQVLCCGHLWDVTEVREALGGKRSVWCRIMGVGSVRVPKGYLIKLVYPLGELYKNRSRREH